VIETNNVSSSINQIYSTPSSSTSRSSKKSATSSIMSSSINKFIVENEKWVENRKKTCSVMD